MRIVRVYETVILLPRLLILLAAWLILWANSSSRIIGSSGREMGAYVNACGCATTNGEHWELQRQPTKPLHGTGVELSYGPIRET